MTINGIELTDRQENLLRHCLTPIEIEGARATETMLQLLEIIRSKPDVSVSQCMCGRADQIEAAGDAIDAAQLRMGEDR